MDIQEAAEDVAEQIGHAVGIAGIDHVEMGSDFDDIAAAANGWEGISKTPALGRVLARGHILPEAPPKEVLSEFRSFFPDRGPDHKRTVLIFEFRTTVGL